MTTKTKYNWWGASDGPSGTGTGSGDKVNKWVDYIPWLYSPIAYGSIVGNVTYIGTQTGTLYAQGYTNPLFTGTPTAQTTLTTITWNIGAIPAYSTYTITLYGTINMGLAGSTTLINYATITTTSTETTLINNYASATTHIDTPSVDLIINKYAHSSVRQGKELIYQILYDNYGQIDAGNVVITEHLPAGVTYGSDTLGNANVTPGTITWQIGTLSSYSFGYFELTVKVDGTGTLINRIKISSPAPETTLVNNIATCTTQIKERLIDLFVDKSALSQIPQGQQLTYRIHYGNYGDKDAVNVMLVDTLPVGVSYATDTLGGNATGTTVTWNLGTVTAGTSSFIELTVHVTAGSGTMLTNQITILPTDGEPANNTASFSTRVIESFSDVWVSKSAPENAAAGYEMTYRLFYGNLGNRVVTNTVLIDKLSDSVTYISDTGVGSVTITDILPPKTSYVSDTLGNATFDTGTITWQLG